MALVLTLERAFAIRFLAFRALVEELAAVTPRAFACLVELITVAWSLRPLLRRGASPGAPSAALVTMFLLRRVTVRLTSSTLRAVRSVLVLPSVRRALLGPLVRLGRDVVVDEHHERIHVVLDRFP